MSKILCSCGHIILDQTDYLKYKADIIPDAEYLSLSERVGEIADSLIEAIKCDKRKEWIDKNFEPGFAHDLDDSSLVHDLFLRKYMEMARQMYQCENCGNILIQKNSGGDFVSFRPESNDWTGIIDKMQS